MRKRATYVGLAFALMLVLAVVMLSGCPKDGVETDGGEVPLTPPDGLDTDAGGDVAAPTGDPVKIGAIFSVTGPAGPLGEPEKMAAELIQDQINAAGGVLGRPLEVIIKDDKSVPDDTVLACQDLIETDKVVAVIGPSRTPCATAIKDICTENEVPLVACAAGQAITQPVEERKWVFAVPQTDTLAVAKIIDYLEAEGITKVATIYVTNSFGESGQAQLELLLGAAGIDIVATESFGGEDADMTPQLTTIKGAAPEAVICWGTNPGPAQVAKDMKKLEIDVPLIQSHGVANAKFLSLARDAAEGVMLPAGRLLVWQSVPDDNEQKPVLKEFAEAFSEKHGQDADTFAGHGYDALHMVINAIEAAGDDDPAKIRDAIEATSGFIGTAGTFNYSASDHNGLDEDAFVWVKIENGAWVLDE